MWRSRLSCMPQDAAQCSPPGTNILRRSAAKALAARHHLGADARLGKYLQQDRVARTPVEHVCLAHAPFERCDAALHLRDHSVAYRAPRDQPLRLGGGESRNELAVLALYALDVGEQDELFGAERGGDVAGGDVGVDVVSQAIAANADRRDHRNEARGFERAQDLRIYFGDFADKPYIDLRRRATLIVDRHFELARDYQVAILARESHRVAAIARDERGDLLVEPLQYHLDRFHRRLVGHPHPAHEARFQPQPLDELVDLRTAAMHHHRVHPDCLKQNHVLSEALAQVRRFHRVPAVLDYEDLAPKELDIGHRLDQHRRNCDRIMHRLLSIAGMVVAPPSA